MSRRLMTCSTGWWVGPSSPTPTESWDQTNTQCALDMAARRTEGRM
jgi:hypothetical protein